MKTRLRFILLITIIIIAVGCFLIFVGEQNSQSPWYIFLITIGAALVVSGTINFLERYFVREETLFFFKEILGCLLQNQFSVLKTSNEIGIRNIYPTWDSFCQSVLPKKISENIVEELDASGIGMTELLRDSSSNLIQLQRFKKVRIVTLDTESDAQKGRDKELPNDATSKFSVQQGVPLIKMIRQNTPNLDIEHLQLKSVIPKATIIRIDKKVIYFCLYRSSTLGCNASFVIETHTGDIIFEQMNQELNYLIGKAKQESSAP